MCRSTLRNERKHRSPLPFPTLAPHPWHTLSSSGALTSFHQPLRGLARSSLSRLNQTLVSAGCSHPSGCCRSKLSLTRTEGPSQPAAGVCLCAHHWIYRSATQTARPRAQYPHPDRHLTQLPFRLSLMPPSGTKAPGFWVVCCNLVLLIARTGLLN